MSNFFFLTYKDITHKDFEIDVTKMYYWQAPIRCLGNQITAATDPKDVIDMTQLRCVEHTEHRWTPDMPVKEINEVILRVYYGTEQKWKPDTSVEELLDKYVVDRGDGGRRFYTIGVMPDMKPTDRVPDGTPAYKWNDNILDYSISLFKKQRMMNEGKWDLSQPVMQVEKIGHRRNWLAMVDRKDAEEDSELNRNITYVCPQPLRISKVSALSKSSFYADFS